MMCTARAWMTEAETVFQPTSSMPLSRQWEIESSRRCRYRELLKRSVVYLLFRNPPFNGFNLNQVIKLLKGRVLVKGFHKDGILKDISITRNQPTVVMVDIRRRELSMRAMSFSSARFSFNFIA